MATYSYTAAVWVRVISTINPSEQVTFSVIDNEGVVLGRTTRSIAYADGWQPLRVIFQTTDRSQNIHYSISRAGAGAATLDVTGYGLYEGRHPAVTFNSGAAPAPSEDLTQGRLLGFRGDSGSNTDLGRMTPIDGALDITLNNDDRAFTPRNTASPYYRRLKKRALVEVQFERQPGIWEPLWTGLYEGIELDTGRNSSKQATLKAAQGLMHLDDQMLKYAPRLNQRSSTMVRDILQGQRLPAKRVVWTLDKSRWGVDTLMDAPAASTAVDTTSFVHPVAGAGWESRISVREALDSLIANEGGFAFIRRDGVLVVRARNALVPTTNALAAPHIVLDTSAQAAKYEYRGVAATQAEVSYTPRYAYNGLIWQTKSENPIKIPRFETVEVLISPQTPEGFPVSIFSYDPPINIHGSPVSSWFRAYHEVNPRMEQYLRVNTYNEGQQIRLVITNTSTDIPDVQVEAALYGFGYATKDAQTLVQQDDTNLDMNDGQPIPLDLTLDLVADEAEVQRVAAHWLRIARHLEDGIFEVAYAFGNSRLDAGRKSALLALKPGDTLLISEVQSGLDKLLHLIVAETFDWTPAGLQLTQTLLPIRPTDVWLLDKSAWGVDTIVGY